MRNAPESGDFTAYRIIERPKHCKEMKLYFQGLANSTPLLEHHTFAHPTGTTVNASDISRTSFRLCTIDHPHHSPRTLSSSPRYRHFSYRRTHHIISEVTMGKDVVTAAVHESIRVRKWSTYRRVILGVWNQLCRRGSTNFHHDQKNHLSPREVPTTQRDEG